MSKTCVIAQPTFLPWLGWFDLADQGDVMVILDDVPFSKQSWQQRNRLRTPTGLEFLSVPVRTSGLLGQLILDCEIADSRFAGRMLRCLKGNYARAKHFRGAFESLSEAVEVGSGSGLLVDLNCAIIHWMASRLAVSTQMIRASSLEAGGKRGDHVGAICEAVGADRYLSPAGAEAYLLEDRQAFDRRGIAVGLQVYEHPIYAQRYSPFMPYASGVDLIFNEGPAAPGILRSGRRSARMLGEPAPSSTEGG